MKFPEVVKFSQLGQLSCSSEKKYRVKRLLSFFKKNNVLEILVSQAHSNDRVLAPSIYSDGEAVCNQGFFAGQNVLVFRDIARSKIFYVSQLSCLVYGVFDLDENVFFSVENNPSRQNSLIKNMLAQRVEIDSSKGRFLGVVNGYDRPYHYFYDKLPYLVDLLDSVPKELKVCSLRGGAFIKSIFLGFENEVIVNSLKEAYEHGEEKFGGKVFFIDVGHPLGFKNKDKVNESLDSFLRSRVLGSLGGGALHNKRESLYIWLGMCSEKRQWLERDAAYRDLILRIVRRLKSPFFILDGLTRPAHISEREFFELPFVKKEEESVAQFISDFGGGVSFISLLGATAEEKLKKSFMVDFFISNALTDSIWCSRFAKKPGVCYSSSNSYEEIFRQHRHPNSVLIPQEMVADQEEGNWSKTNFSIAPNIFSEFAFKVFSETVLQKGM